MQTLDDLIREKRYAEARRRLHALAAHADSYAALAKLCRRHQRLAAQAPAPVASTVKIAILGTGTTDFIPAALSLALDAWRLGSNIRTADYHTYGQEMLEPDSATARFSPDVALVVNSPMNLPVHPVPGDSAPVIDAKAAEAADYWLRLCDALHRHAGCDIVLDNYHLPTPSPNGALAAKLAWDLGTFVRRVNLELGSRAPTFVHVHDVDTLAAEHGLARWFDARLWYEAKLPVSPQCLPAYVRSLAGIIGAIYGQASKCIVLDLDNTLWGGVVGDDGADGIRIGAGDPAGEAFLAFQQYLAALRRRGILLAVASKNEVSHALAPFAQRPEMALKADDFVAFRANWDSKPDNLRAIASDLNLGLDALLFVDDNPREREHVRQQLPEVRVVDLSEDPADYPRLLDATGWLEVVRISEEDRHRTDQYRADQERVRVQESAADYAGYLSSLAQVAVIGNFDTNHLNRIAQLINKTNQFNLTTRRQTQSEVEAEMRDPARLTAWVRLADRFGDNGLISVLSARRAGDSLDIDQWLMSCRVLGRGVEQLLLNWIGTRARDSGVRTLTGTYVPTARNALVRNHYHSLGFRQVTGTVTVAPGATTWTLGLGDFAPVDVPIGVVDGY